jgi:hypothetical protein
VLAAATVWLVFLMLRAGRELDPDVPGDMGTGEPRVTPAKAAETTGPER